MTELETVAAERDRLLAACRAIANVNHRLSGHTAGIDEFYWAIVRIDKVLVGVQDLVVRDWREPE